MPDSEPPLDGLGLDALDGRDGPARRLSSREVDARVLAAVDGALPLPRTFARRKTGALLFAATLCVAGVSAGLFIERSSPTGVSPSGSAPAKSSTPVQKRAAPDTRNAVPKPSRVAETARATPPEASGSNVPEPSARAVSAADLMKTANQLRRQGRWADAERAYSQVASTYGGTAQGPVAALAAASLRLEHLGDPRGALRLYETALRASSLSAEAELGIANAYRALGDRAAEIRALRRLVSAYPEAVFHERARARLRALEAEKP